jgi:hypothetical protein
MAVQSEQAKYMPNVPIPTDDGMWFSIATDAKEAVQVLIPYRSANEPQPDFSVWWDGSASPRVVRDWVAETLESMKNPALECRVEIWADEAPEESKAYRIENVGRIAEDIQGWASDAAVGCSIADAPQDRELVYMWAELKAPDEKTHPGEVGLKYGAKVLDTIEGKLVFSRLLEGTALRSFTKGQIEQVYTMVRNNVLKYASF